MHTPEREGHDQQSQGKAYHHPNGLVRSRKGIPAAVDELQLSILYERASEIFLLLGLLVPPAGKKPDFHIDELPVGIFGQAWYHL